MAEIGKRNGRHFPFRSFCGISQLLNFVFRAGNFLRKTQNEKNRWIRNCLLIPECRSGYCRARNENGTGLVPVPAFFSGLNFIFRSRFCHLKLISVSKNQADNLD